MATWLSQMIDESDNRYFSEQEYGQLLTYAESVSTRLTVAREVETAEAEILAEVDQRLAAANGEKIDASVKQEHLKCMTLVIRYDVQAMLLNDPTFLDERILHFLASMLKSFGLSQDYIRKSYQALAEVTLSKVSPDGRELIRPCLERNIAVLVG